MKRIRLQQEVECNKPVHHGGEEREGLTAYKFLNHSDRTEKQAVLQEKQ